MFNAMFQVIMALSLMLGPKDMTSLAVQFDQPDTSHRAFTATQEANGYWKIVDPLWKDPYWYKIEGKTLLVKNDKGQMSYWPIKDKMDVSSLQKQANSYSVRLEDYSSPVTISRLSKGLRCVQNASTEPGQENPLLPPLTVTFNK